MYTVEDLKPGVAYRRHDGTTGIITKISGNYYDFTNSDEEMQTGYIKYLLNKLNSGTYTLLPEIHPVMQEAVNDIFNSITLSGDTDYQDINNPELPGGNEPDFSSLEEQGEPPNAAHAAVSAAINDPIYSVPEKICEMRKAADLWTKLNHRIEEHNVALLEIRSIRDELAKLSVFDFLHLDYETVETNPDNPQIGMLLLPGTRPIFKN